MGLCVTGRITITYDEESNCTDRRHCAGRRRSLPRSAGVFSAVAGRARPLRTRAAGRAAGHDQAVLRRVSQRPREDRRRQLRGHHAPRASAEHADLFEKAVRKLRGRVMPPPGAKQPDAAAVDSLVAWLEDVARSLRQARRTSRTRSSCTGSTARNTRTRFAICWPSTSTRTSFCRQTTSPRASTTSRRRCRCRRPSSSNTSSPRAPSP